MEWKQTHVKGYWVSEDGLVFSALKKKILKPQMIWTGYVQAGLGDDIHPRRRYYIHRLVAAAFHPNLLQLPYVNHINGIRDDNRASNLEWITMPDNLLHAKLVLGKRLGAPPHEARWNAKLKLADLERITLLRDSGMPYQKIGDVFGVNPKTIWNVLKGKTWARKET